LILDYDVNIKRRQDTNTKWTNT